MNSVWTLLVIHIRFSITYFARTTAKCKRLDYDGYTDYKTKQSSINDQAIECRQSNNRVSTIKQSSIANQTIEYQQSNINNQTVEYQQPNNRV